MDVTPITERVCDFCNERIADENHTAVKSFVLTDWGAICIECWDYKVKHYEEFQIVRTYAKSENITDGWVRQPMVIDFE